MQMHPAANETMKAFLEKIPEIDAAYLHGSAAKGTMHPGSDVDIALLPVPGKRVSLTERLHHSTELESLLGRPVDMGILSTRNLVYAKEVIDHGTELFSKNRFRSDLFLGTCLSMYAELQQQRKEVLHAYSAG
jgi:predicted nucleotidyltransferase